MTQRVPLMLLGTRLCHCFHRPLRPFLEVFSNRMPGLQKDLRKTGIELTASRYLNVAIVNAGVWFLLFALLFFGLLFVVQEEPLQGAILRSLLYGLGLGFLMVIVFIRYPRILAGKKAEEIDTYLVFALKEMLLQVNSGVSLYSAIVNVGRQNYGSVSEEFAQVGRDVNAGVSMRDALERLAGRTESQVLRRTVWQLINALQSGSSIDTMLHSMIEDATMDKRTRIRDFSHELNLWGLLYMTFAVAVPAIGLMMMIILSTFGGAGVTKGGFIAFVAIGFFAQIGLIGFIKSRRPVVSA